VERSDEELRITELMYNEGMGAQIDLINAQTENQRVRTDYLNAVNGMYAAIVEFRKAIGDYAPDEDGTWKEAVARYGKGTDVANEMQTLKLKEQKN
jgi:outer membrane protein TolC